MPIYTLEQAQLLRAKDPHSQEIQWLYNTLDVTGTREVFDTIHPRLNKWQQRTYAFERSLQAPAQSMMNRGIAIDMQLRAKMVKDLERELKKDLASVDKMETLQNAWDKTELETGWCPAAIGKHHSWPKGVPDAERKCKVCGASRVRRKPFNPNSSDDVYHLFYNVLKVKPYLNKKHQQSVEGDILERIGHDYPQHIAITDAIFDVRDKRKQLGTLNARLSRSNRYPSSFNVGAAWTGRFSASKNPYGEGGNAQNLASRHRRAFIADPAKLLVYADLKQAESNVVAHISGDEVYINAHLSGDVHTYVARLVWPELPWNGDLKKDKKIAKQLPEWDNVEGHDFRFQAKRIQHGSNFGLTPRGIAMIARIPIAQAEKAQGSYFDAFPKIRTWQYSTIASIRDHFPLYNVLDREITLFGRPWDGHTQKQGLAFKPQSAVADILDLAMWRVWDQLDPDGARTIEERKERYLELLAQVHDALLAQFPEDRMYILHEMRRLMQIPIPVTDMNGVTRVMQIEAEIAVGRNWGKQTEDNPNGMWEPPEFNI
jgi:DNA polymerase I-like protein with 3'-5' exonuclease and polymerase domains